MTDSPIDPLVTVFDGDGTHATPLGVIAKSELREYSIAGNTMTVRYVRGAARRQAVASQLVFDITPHNTHVRDAVRRWSSEIQPQPTSRL